jgi:hypothetical protein
MATTSVLREAATRSLSSTDRSSINSGFRRDIGRRMAPTIAAATTTLLVGGAVGLALRNVPRQAGPLGISPASTSVNLTERGTFTNLYPGDRIGLQFRARTLVQDADGRYWLQSAGGQQITPSGLYDFVRMPNGTIRVARPNTNPELSTHLGLSGGNEVSYAGSIRFANSNTATRGNIRSWSNSSGHYQPPVSHAGNAGLPINLFTPHRGP